MNWRSMERGVCGVLLQNYPNIFLKAKYNDPTNVLVYNKTLI
jgi:hypothetical protein